MTTLSYRLSLREFDYECKTNSWNAEFTSEELAIACSTRSTTSAQSCMSGNSGDNDSIYVKSEKGLKRSSDDSESSENDFKLQTSGETDIINGTDNKRLKCDTEDSFIPAPNRTIMNTTYDDGLISTLDISCIDACSETNTPEKYTSKTSFLPFLKREDSYSMCATRHRMGLKQLPFRISSSTVRSYNIQDQSSLELDSEFYSITEEELRDPCCIGKEKTLRHVVSGLSDNTTFLEDQLYQLPISDKAFQPRPTLLKRLKNYTNKKSKKRN